MKAEVLRGFEFSKDGVTTTYLSKGQEVVITDDKTAKSLEAEGYIKDLSQPPAPPQKTTLTLKK